MPNYIRNGLRSGFVFGIVIIFLILIGFTRVANELLAPLVKGTSQLPMGFILFMALLGLWAGASAAKRSPVLMGMPDTYQKWNAIISGLIAGIIGGAFVGLFIFVLGSIQTKGMDMRVYLAQLSPDAIKMLTLGRVAWAGAFSIWLIFVITGIAGGLLALFSDSFKLGERMSSSWKNMSAGIGDSAIAKTVNQNAVVRYILYGIFIIILLILPSFLGKYWNYTLGTIGIYIIMGLGINIIIGMAGLLNLGYVAFFAVGAYTVGLLTAPAPQGLHWNFWIGLLIAMVMAAFVGWLLGIPVLRLRGDYLAIVTLGFGEMIRVLVRSKALSSIFGGPQGVRDIAGPMIFGQRFTEREYLYLIVAVIIFTIFITIRLQNSHLGRAWGAMREDQTVAQAMGINIFRYKLLAFALGAAIGGLAGVMFASRNQYTGPEDHTLMVSVNVLALVIVGGMGSIPGIILGSFVLKGLPELLRQIEDYRLLVFGGLLVVMMIVKPEGLWPSKRRQLEMSDVDLPPETDALQVLEEQSSDQKLRGES